MKRNDSKMNRSVMDTLNINICDGYMLHR